MAWHQVFSLYFDNRADKAANGKWGKASAHATASTSASTAAANWQLALPSFAIAFVKVTGGATWLFAPAEHVNHL